MELNVQRKQKEKKAAIKLTTIQDKKPPRKKETRPNVRSIHVNKLLYSQIQNYIDGLHAGRDFKYTSVADFIRSSLDAYKDGMKLTEDAEKGSGPKKQTSVRLSDETLEFYVNLPDQKRTAILEMAIRTHLKNQQ